MAELWIHLQDLLQQWGPSLSITGFSFILFPIYLVCVYSKLRFYFKKVWKNAPTSIISEISLLEDPMNSKWSCLYRRQYTGKSFGIGASTTILSWRIYRKAWCIYHVIKDYDIIWYAMDLPLTKIKVVVVPKLFMYVSTKYKTSFFPVHY